MRKVLFICVSLLFVSVLATGCSGPDKCCGTCGGDCTCNSAESAGCEKCGLGIDGKNGWCDACGKGYFDGKEVTCKGCYEAMAGGPPCEKCKK